MANPAAADLDLNDPGVRNTIIRQYERYGENFTISEYGVNRQRIERWRNLVDETGSLVPLFDLRGAKSKLLPQEIKRIEAGLIKDPYATNADLAALIGNKISAREAGNIIAKSSMNFKWVLEGVDLEESFTPEIVEEGKAFLKETHNLKYSDRVYMDETFASSGIPRAWCRLPEGKKKWSPRNRKYPRMVILSAITQNGWLHPSKIYHKPSITDEDFDDYVKKVLAPCLRRGQTVLWDQYGKFGRTKNPHHRHFSLKARNSIEARGAKLKILPRYGKLLDPIEMVFGDTKREYNKLVRKSTGSKMPSNLTFNEKVKLWREAEQLVSPSSFVRAFKERASGKEFYRVSKEKGLL